ncbi:MAG: FAD:protein FMN transferase [Gemmatimonadota bacterium]
MTASSVRSAAMMGTVVSILVNRPADDACQQTACDTAITEALSWFAQVESVCSRFEPTSELCALSRQIGSPMRVGELLFEVLHFALGVADRTGGAFDPTVGDTMIARGIARNHRSARLVERASSSDVAATFRDVVTVPDTRMVTLHRPLTLDLGAVAKGMAIDLAAKALCALDSFAIDAGGDIFAGGQNANNAPWVVGIRHPRRRGDMIATVSVSNLAVCTSGTYERGEHLVHLRVGAARDTLASATVIAPSAMVADALATAACVLGADEGLDLLVAEGVEGLLIRTDLTMVRTPAFPDA